MLTVCTSTTISGMFSVPGLNGIKLCGMELEEMEPLHWLMFLE